MRITEVVVRRAGLVLVWVTVRGCTVVAFNPAMLANLAWPSLRNRDVYWPWS